MYLTCVLTIILVAASLVFSENSSMKLLGVGAMIFFSNFILFMNSSITGPLMFILFAGGVMLIYMFLLFLCPSQAKSEITQLNWLPKILLLAFLGNKFSLNWSTDMSMENPSSEFSNEMLESISLVVFIVMFLLIVMLAVAEFSKFSKAPLRKM